MAFLRENGKCFVEHPSALYATDVMFQQVSRSCRNMMEAKPYFSGKHELHSFKTDASVLANGICIYLSGHAKEVEADISIFCRRLQKQKAMTKKAEGEHDLSNTENSTINHWVILADKGYQGLQSDVRIFISKKKTITWLFILF